VEAEVLREAGHRVDFFDLPKPGAGWRWPFKALPAIVRAVLYLPLVLRLRRGGYDWVHVHFVSQGVIGLATGRPFFVHVHGSDLRRPPAWSPIQAINARVLRGAVGIFYVTPELRPLLVEHEAKSRWLPNPISPTYLEVPPHDGPIRRLLLFLRLDSVKGPERVFAVAGELAEMADLTAIRGGPLAAGYERRWGTKVRFIDPLPASEVLGLLEGFDCVIGQMELGVPGLSELESMAAGRAVLMRLDADLFGDDPPPVVATDGGADLVAKLGRLIADPAEAARRAIAGREWVRRHHGFAAHLAILESAYRESGLSREGSRPAGGGR
jgi:glycosyltransferase involved in cell wall biosynthesis